MTCFLGRTRTRWVIKPVGQETRNMALDPVLVQSLSTLNPDSLKALSDAVLHLQQQDMRRSAEKADALYSGRKTICRHVVRDLFRRRRWPCSSAWECPAGNAEERLAA